MLEWWNNLSLAIFDNLIGWLLSLPRDATLVAVAIGTAAILTLVRRFTTNQDLLRRAAQDRKRLKTLAKEAKKRGDKDALKRFRAARSNVAMKTLKYEGLPLLVSILPIALLATWCLFRLEFHPPAEGEAVKVIAYTPASAAGQVMHIVPQDGLAADAWVQPVEAVTDQGMAHGMATWTLRGAAAEQPYRLIFRTKGKDFDRDLLIGRRTYAKPVVRHSDQFVTELKMRPFELFGVIPGIPTMAVPPWLVAYFLVAVPFVSILKRVCRIY